MNGALALLDTLASQSLGAGGQSAITFATGHTNALVRDLFQRLIPAEQRRRTLGTDINPQTVLALTGNAARGQELFVGASQCSRCHVSAGAGRSFGPDLSAVAAKYSRAQLLDQILYPSKIIAPEYKLTSLTLNDDTELSGFVLKRTSAELTLRDETLAERVIKREDVKSSRESTLSAMPEGLLASMTAQDAADLLEYLATNKLSTPATR